MSPTPPSRLTISARSCNLAATLRFSYIIASYFYRVYHTSLSFALCCPLIARTFIVPHCYLMRVVVAVVDHGFIQSLIFHSTFTTAIARARTPRAQQLAARIAPHIHAGWLYQSASVHVLHGCVAKAIYRYRSITLKMNRSRIKSVCDDRETCVHNCNRNVASGTA